jgi:1,4-alpha-glucan branching enzyme
LENKKSVIYMKKIAKNGTDSSGQTFSVLAPGAQRVLLLLEFEKQLHRLLLMKPLADGSWNVSVPLPAGLYRYGFMVDGKRRDDLISPAHADLATKVGAGEALLRLVPQGQQNQVRAAAVPIRCLPPSPAGWKLAPPLPPGSVTKTSIHAR